MKEMFKGTICAGDGLREALEIVGSMKGLQTGVLQVHAGDASGLVGLASGQIIGALLNSGETARKALRQILQTRQGNFIVLDAGAELLPELRQGLKIDVNGLCPYVPNNISIETTPWLFDSAERTEANQRAAIIEAAVQSSSIPPPAAPPNDPFAVMRIPDFRFLVAVRVLFMLALQIQVLSVGWQIYEITKSPLWLGMIGLAEAVPAIASALYAGHIVDIVDRKLMMILSVSVMGICIGGLATLCCMHFPSTLLCLLMCTLIMGTGLARSLYRPSMFGLVSQIVPRHLYGNAAAWNSAALQSSLIGGPLLGGVLYVKVGAALTYAAAVALLVVCVFCMLMVKCKPEMRTASNVSALESIAEGLKFVRSNQLIAGAMSLDLFATLFGGAMALLPIIVDQVLHRGPEALGTLRAAPATGALIIVLILTFMPISTRAGWILFTAVACFGLCMIGLGLSTNYYLSLGMLFLSGLFDGVNGYIRDTVYQHNTPAEMKGRVSALNGICITSSNEIGAFESGVAARLMGTVPSIVFGGCVTLLVVLITALKARKLRQLEL